MFVESEEYTELTNDIIVHFNEEDLVARRIKEAEAKISKLSL